MRRMHGILIQDLLDDGIHGEMTGDGIALAAVVPDLLRSEGEGFHVLRKAQGDVFVVAHEFAVAFLVIFLATVIEAMHGLEIEEFAFC